MNTRTCIHTHQYACVCARKLSDLRRRLFQTAAGVGAYSYRRCLFQTAAGVGAYSYRRCLFQTAAGVGAYSYRRCLFQTAAGPWHDCPQRLTTPKNTRWWLPILRICRIHQHYRDLQCSARIRRHILALSCICNVFDTQKVSVGMYQISSTTKTQDRGMRMLRCSALCLSLLT
jgi:hypothetical protein